MSSRNRTRSYIGGQRAEVGGQERETAFRLLPMSRRVGQRVSPAPLKGLPSEKGAGETRCPTLTPASLPAWLTHTSLAGKDAGAPRRCGLPSEKRAGGTRCP